MVEILHFVAVLVSIFGMYIGVPITVAYLTDKFDRL
jgi:hypothetical protein